MRALAVLCNLVSLAFTLLVVATEGESTKTPYVVLTLLALAVPIFTVYALVRGGAGRGWLSGPAGDGAPGGQPGTDVAPPTSAAVARAAAVCNIVLLGFFCWALVDQYPHPSEEGFVAYVVLMLLTPVLSAVLLLRGGARRGRHGAARPADQSG